MVVKHKPVICWERTDSSALFTELHCPSVYLPVQVQRAIMLHSVWSALRWWDVQFGVKMHLSTDCPHSIILRSFLSQLSGRITQRLHPDAGDSQLLGSLRLYASRCPLLNHLISTTAEGLDSLWLLMSYTFYMFLVGHNYQKSAANNKSMQDTVSQHRIGIVGHQQLTKNL